MNPPLVMAGSYDYRFVVLSALIAVMASYTALDLAGRVTSARSKARAIWLIGGSLTLGIGMWSMHFTGMPAFHSQGQMKYHWPTVLISLFIGVCSSVPALFVVSRPQLGMRLALAASTFISISVAGLHYSSMASMRLSGTCHFSPPLVILSVVFAIVFSLLSLWLTFLFRKEAAGQWRRKLGGSLLMGAAICAMHYTGMAATTFTRPAAAPDLSHAVAVSSLGVAGIGSAAVVILWFTIVTSMVDKLREQRSLLDELFEQSPQAIALLNPDGGIIRTNREFSLMFGYGPQECIGRGLNELIVPEELQTEARSRGDLATCGQRVVTEGVRQRRDGSRLQVAMIRVPISVPGGRIAGLAIYRDITESKRHEEELNQSFDQLRALTARLQGIREEERKRVAREIHDELGQALTAIKLDLASLVRELPVDQAQEIKAESILSLVDQTIQVVRRISTELRPGILDDLGLVAAIEWAAEEFQARTGTKCRVDVPEDDIIVGQERATAIFRILQETLTNIARHASATQVDISLNMDDGDVALEVRDNGCGISEEHLTNRKSLGMLGMRERAHLLGGKLRVSGTPGVGTIVRVRIPDTQPGAPPDQGK
jgi:PAS domain S-box-containing protein